MYDQLTLKFSQPFLYTVVHNDRPVNMFLLSKNRWKMKLVSVQYSSPDNRTNFSHSRVQTWFKLQGGNDKLFPAETRFWPFSTDDHSTPTERLPPIVYKSERILTIQYFKVLQQLCVFVVSDDVESKLTLYQGFLNYEMAVSLAQLELSL